MNILRATCVFLILSLLMGCEEESLPVRPIDSAWFPLRPAQTWIYQVDSLLIQRLNNQIVRDSSSFYWQFTLAEASDTLGEEGQYFSLFRSRSSQPRGPWVPDGTLQYGLEENRAVRIEDNLPFWVLVFPPRLGKEWDGNLGFDSDRPIRIAGEELRPFRDWQYRYADQSERVILNGQEYEDVWQVEQADLEDILRLRRAEEWYARDVGLIYRAWEIRDTQCETCCAGILDVCRDIPWSGKTELGFVLKMQLIDHY